LVKNKEAIPECDQILSLFNDQFFLIALYCKVCFTLRRVIEAMPAALAIEKNKVQISLL
jgi:hypothetical protein